MAHLIDKDALVAEIERKRNDYINSFMTEQVHVLNDVLDFLDTLETKQVNLDAELEHYKADQNIKYEEDINMFEFAKHFFELGLQSTQKEEPKKCMYSKDDYTDEDRKVLCNGCEEECKYSHSVNVPFDSKNYELIEATYYIPKGMCAIIEDDKVIIKKK